MLGDDDVPELLDTGISIDSNRRIPLTLITGFLGAGKSTLLQRILTEHHGYRIAVIMNEFADTADIESRAISVSDTSNKPSASLSSDTLELANGCLCCSIKDAGVAAIENLMRKKGAFDYILLETTGLADPGPIVSMFWQNEEFPSSLGNDIYLDGVLCVVDAVFGSKQLREDHASSGIGESLRQIASADIVLLNKCDLASAEAISQLQDELVAINPNVPIYKTARAQIDIGKIIGLDVFRSRASLAQPVETTDPSHTHEEEHNHETHLHSISSVQVSIPPLSQSQLDKLDEWTRTLLWETELISPDHSTTKRDIEVLRAKGMFRVSNSTYMLQAVRSLYEINPVSSISDQDGSLTNGKLVFIGKGLDEEVKRSLLKFIQCEEPDQDKRQ